MQIPTDNSDQEVIKEYILRYISFWPFFLISLIIFIFSAFIYLRYTTNIFQSSAKIEIIDKAQDSEMALPTSMTIFNRSMINLENEIGVLKSYELNRRVVKNLNSNIRFFSVGNLRNTELHKDELFEKYEIEYKDNIDSFAGHIFSLTTENNILFVEHIFQDQTKNKYSFKNLSTLENTHDLPFELSISKVSKSNSQIERIISVDNFDRTVQRLISSTQVSPAGANSDQLDIKFLSPNKLIAKDFLNSLINEFDQDGIEDRRSQYFRTIKFVESRSKIILEELELVENRKEQYKIDNNLADINSSTSSSIELKYKYDNELFNASSQLDLLLILAKTIDDDIFEILPINIGLNNATINSFISDYNLKVKEYERFKSFAGPNNNYLIRIQNELVELQKSILESIDNYKSSLEKTISNLNKKQGEFDGVFKNLPENEKTLRAIDRELNVKEALFLLLLQKKEEASINYAVIKPSIKVIDFAKVNNKQVYPNTLFVFFVSIVLSFLAPFVLISIIFFFDNKIHTKDQLKKVLNSNIPIIGEIPQIENNKDLALTNENSRTSLSESIRMIISNSEFVINDVEKSGKIYLVTSSIKGEGKTLVSTHFSSLLSENKKVLLVGVDLRNPQIHKIIGVNNKNTVGLTNYLVDNSPNKKIEDYLIKNNNLDILLSGLIPPNPTQMIASKEVEQIFTYFRSKYDAIVIDSAPCLLVSDSFGLSSFADQTIYVFRANHTNKNIIDFINEIESQSKFKNLSLVLNGIGSSQFYGYKYGYQYGYQYGYKYSYNYGYGYGYGNDKK